MARTGIAPEDTAGGSAVRLDDVRAALHGLAGAICGLDLVFEAVADSPAWVPRRQRWSVEARLPEQLDIHPTRAGNRGAYRALALEAAGYIRFGTWAPVLMAADGTEQTVNAALDDEPPLTATLFNVLERYRIDASLRRTFRGGRADIERLRAWQRARQSPTGVLATEFDLVTTLTWLACGGSDAASDPRLTILWRDMSSRLVGRDAAVSVAFDAARRLQRASTEWGLVTLAEAIDTDTSATLELAVRDMAADAEDQIAARELDMLEQNAAEGSTVPVLAPPDSLEDGGTGSGANLTDVDLPEVDRRVEELLEAMGQNVVGKRRQQPLHDPAGGWLYPEWDFQRLALLPDWCRVTEVEPEPLPDDLQHAADATVSRRLRRLLADLKPTRFETQYNLEDGTELDVDRVVAFRVERRVAAAGTPRVYTLDQRARRSVAALFLVDLSASTDEAINPPPPPPLADDDDILPWGQQLPPQPEPGRRIVDVERDAVLALGEALRSLGDQWAVYGFSSDGREEVRLVRGKEFRDPWNDAARERIRRFAPYRGTRMGTALRHAWTLLRDVDAEQKLCLLISDGYPQDRDYGEDRNSREYGIFDTMAAMAELRRHGVTPVLHYVDRAGHDYLRRICPADQYAVISDVEQLPEAVAITYRSLTT